MIKLLLSTKYTSYYCHILVFFACFTFANILCYLSFSFKLLSARRVSACLLLSHVHFCLTPRALQSHTSFVFLVLKISLCKAQNNKGLYISNIQRKQIKKLNQIRYFKRILVSSYCFSPSVVVIRTFVILVSYKNNAYCVVPKYLFLNMPFMFQSVVRSAEIPNV